MTHAIGIERATAWFDREFNGLPDTASLVTGIVAAYLSALKPSGDAGEVVEGLRGQIEHVSLRLSCRMPNTDSAVYELMWRATEAANLITTLERQLATAREALEKIVDPANRETTMRHIARSALTPGVSDAE